MVMKMKNGLIVTLMVSSVLLLIMLEFFWLRSAYKDAGEDFRRQTSNIFRNTIFAMHDSIIEKSIEPVRGDSNVAFLKHSRFKIHNFPDPMEVDTLIDLRRKSMGAAKVEVHIAGEGRPDSVTRIIRRMIPKLPPDASEKMFIIRLGPDSLQIDSIRKEFRHSLRNEGIDANFVIYTMRKTPIDKRPVHMRDIFSTEVVSFSPATHYAASFVNADKLILKKIFPQICFAIFLTALTGGAFYIVYRNLRTQQRLMESKNEFISNVTHELKTPVATVSVTLEALKNFNVMKNPSLSQEYLEIAQRELKRLNDITDRILKTSVLEKKIVVTKETTNLHFVIQDVLSDMKLILDQRNAKVSYQQNGIDFPVHCDAYHLYQMVENLIDNALKYSLDEPVIEVDLISTNNSVMLSIKDHGIGIEQEYQSKIFEKFFRVPTGDVHTIKGYGLGLSYVYNLVKSLGGQIHVQSEPKVGSTFIIKFPNINVNEFSFRIGQ
jgi:two-component system, OmpR family, phosphate regulon sensor histidine kinase PhoR